MCEKQMKPILMKDVLKGRDESMIFEKNRLKSFIKWPFSGGKITKQAMSGCGFYHCNIDGETDGVRCFCCFKELDGWDPNDEPWTEHKRNNKCFFANLAKTEDNLTLHEFISILEERRRNLVNKRFEEEENEENKLLSDLGLNSSKQ